MRDRKAYNAAYYQKNKRSIRAQQNIAYRSKFRYASAELLEHLRSSPTHATGRLAERENCPTCIQKGAELAVCLECGRMNLRARGAHPCKKGRASLTSPEFRRYRSKLSSSPENVKRLKQMAFTSERTSVVNRGRKRPLFARPDVKNWPIAELRLAGEEYGAISEKLGVSQPFVLRRCRAMGFPPGAPVFFWRGEPVSPRLLRELMRERGLDTAVLASKIGLHIHRIQRALRDKKRGLLRRDIAGRLLEAIIAQPLLHVGPAGRTRKLSSAARKELAGKYRALLGAIQTVVAELGEIESAGRADVGEAICRLARNRSDGRMLLFWSAEFFDWLDRNAPPDMVVQCLSPPHDTARQFLAEQFGVKLDRSPDALPTRDDAKPISDADRQSILDVYRAFGESKTLHTRDLLSNLRATEGPSAKLTERKLGRLARLAGHVSTTIRHGQTVLKGYRRADFGFFTTPQVANTLVISVATLKARIADGTIPAPAPSRSSGVRGAGRVRVWLPDDIRKAKDAAYLITLRAERRSVTNQRYL